MGEAASAFTCCQVVARTGAATSVAIGSSYLRYRSTASAKRSPRAA